MVGEVKGELRPPELEGGDKYEDEEGVELWQASKREVKVDGGGGGGKIPVLGDL